MTTTVSAPATPLVRPARRATQPYPEPDRGITTARLLDQLHHTDDEAEKQALRAEVVVLNMGVGDAVNDRKKAETAAGELTQIAGQKAIVTYSRVAIATFKLRENQPIGCKVTLRKAKMYEFIDRLVNVALPRVRDFRGLNPKSFDGRGNYSLGLKEHIIFPEIDFDKVSEARGMDITVCTTARTDDEARALLTAFNFPFRQ